MSYYLQFYRQPNPPRLEEATKSPFFSKHHDTGESSQKNAFFQAKLSVNAPVDKYEKEADSIATAVVNQPAEKSMIQKKGNQAEKEKKKEIHKKDDSSMDEKKKKKIVPVQAKQDGAGAADSPQVSSQIENAAGKGNQLPQKTLHEMNSSFGADFSGVKIHHDNEANTLNQELQAQAFTHGNDIYFNKGKYNPENRDGKFLLAHELTHVVQQEGTVQTKQIQRSFWGTVGGAVIGAGAGFLVGGPVGAIIGGVAGGVSGDAATTHSRGINEPELEQAQRVFGDSLDYSAVSLSDSSELAQIGGYARTPGNTVYFPTGTLGRTDLTYFAFLIHELTHTWQTQHGVSVLTKIRYSLSESNYNFGGDAGLSQAIKDGKCFNDFNTEAQASILEQYYKILTGIAVGDLSIYEHFVLQVQLLKGRCGSSGAGVKTDTLDPKFKPAGGQEKSFA